MENRDARTLLRTGSALLGIGVALGAFGAHALKEMVTPALLETWKTGTHYQLIHGLGLLALGAYAPHSSIKLTWVYWLLTLGVIGFSGNCYLYVLTGMKAFAMIIPLGGICMILGWSVLFLNLLKSPAR